VPVAQVPVSVSITTSTSFPASKAEEKARKKELKAQYKAVKQDAKAREKEVHRQADEIKRELKREVSHQAKMAVKTANSSSNVQHAPSLAPGPSRSPMMINPISQLGQLAVQHELAKQERRLAHDLYKTQKHQARQERKEQRRMDREIRREHRHGHFVPVGPAIAVAPAVSVVSVPPIVVPGTFVAPVTHATPPQPYYPQQQWPLYPPVPQEQPQYRQDVVVPEKPLPKIKGEKDIGAQDPLLVYSMSGLSLRPSSSSPCSIPTPSAPPLRALVVTGPQGQEDETASGAPPPPYEPVDSTHSPSIPQKVPL
ncbi:hypothetical protein BGX31_011603, partial [Mortierella sp. GBA43]